MHVRITQKSAFSQLSQQVILIDVFVEATGWIVDSAGMSNQMGEFHQVHNEMRNAILWLSMLLTDGCESKIPLHDLLFFLRPTSIPLITSSPLLFPLYFPSQFVYLFSFSCLLDFPHNHPFLFPSMSLPPLDLLCCFYYSMTIGVPSTERAENT